MTRERKRVWGELAAWHAARVIAYLPLTAAILDPQQINPYGDSKPMTEEMKKLLEWKEQIKLKALAGLV